MIVQPNTPPCADTNFDAYVEYVNQYLEPISFGIDSAFCTKYPDDWSEWGARWFIKETLGMVRGLATYLVPEGLDYPTTQKLAESLAMHLFDVIDGRVPLRSDLLRTLLLAHDRDVRLWAIQHSAIKSSR